MTAIEIKTEIQKALNDVSEEALYDILSFIKNFQNQNDVKSDKNFERIINEHRDLLTRLAQ